MVTYIYIYVMVSSHVLMFHGIFTSLDHGQVKGLLEDLAAKHSGDMQTHLAFHRSRCLWAPRGGYGATEMAEEWVVNRL